MTARRPAGSTMMIALALLVLLGVGGFLWMRIGPIRDRLEPVGPFDIVTHTTRYLDGWNTGQLRLRTTEHYSLRYHRTPWPVPARSGSYSTLNAVITFPGDTPALVVNTGDPNNESAYYLIRERAEAGASGAAAEWLGPGQGGVSALWLDRPAAAGEQINGTVHRARMEGGRWLLLGDLVVLDTRTLGAWHLEPPYAASVHPYKPPLGLSPDAMSFIRFGSDANDAPILLVADFVAGSWAILPIDRGSMRYNDWEELDAGWVERHFTWVTTPGGHARLERRARFVPLPHRGKRFDDPLDHRSRSYQLVRVVPAMVDSLVSLLQREFGAGPLESDGRGDHQVRIGERTLLLVYRDNDLSLFMRFGEENSLVFRIADRFDTTLATGAYDSLFLP